eukprot:TRINITY_DN4920_c0_g1_i2.p2 TRINITY_DN4920_c0_g1~~TRINITY_DN4920_c0_g1_i2.p2  ORF type:complete len:292 (+),score=128.43 TRINITY_DN4920_c0_g1_i2:1597-2472(+)
MRSALKRFGMAAVGGAAAFTYSSCAAEDRYELNQAGFSPDEFRKFALRNKVKLSHDSYKFTFEYPRVDMHSGIQVAGLVVLKCKGPDGKNVIRPYTPTSAPEQQGTFDLVVKVYPGAKMGGHLADMVRGDLVEVKGPWRKIEITPNKYKNIGMVAGGTGITPMYQIIRHLLQNKSDQTNLSLIYANRSEKDILLKLELEELERLHPRFKVYHTVNEATFSWEQGVGNVNADSVRSLMPADSDENVVLVCGPPGMMKAVCGDKDFAKSPPGQGELDGILKDLNYSQSNVFKF